MTCMYVHADRCSLLDLVCIIIKVHLLFSVLQGVCKAAASCTSTTQSMNSDCVEEFISTQNHDQTQASMPVQLLIIDNYDRELW